MYNMPLNGGTIVMNGQDIEKELSLKGIIQDSNTTIELLKVGHGPEYVYKLTFQKDAFSSHFLTSGTSDSPPSVLIIKILTHNLLRYTDDETKKMSIREDTSQFQHEVDIHKHLSSLTTTNPYPICPSFLYSKQTKLGINITAGNLDAIILEKLNETNQSYKKKTVNLYDYLTQDSMKKVQTEYYEKYYKAGGRTLGMDIVFWKNFKFDDTTQTIIFMEYAPCETLDYTLNNVKDSDINAYISNLYGMPLPFDKTHKTLTTRKASFSCFVLLFVSILLLREGIIHGDLHEGNVLICKRENGKIDAVVIDFGRSAFINDVYIRAPILDMKKHNDESVTPIKTEANSTSQVLTPDLAMEKYRKDTLMEKYKDTILKPIIDIFDEISTGDPNGPEDMTQYFDKLRTEGDFVKAALASTMCCGNTQVSMFQFYMEALDAKSKYPPYSDIFNYYILQRSYDFNKLIREALDARTRFYTTLTTKTTTTQRATERERERAGSIKHDSFREVSKQVKEGPNDLPSELMKNGTFLEDVKVWMVTNMKGASDNDKRRFMRKWEWEYKRQQKQKETSSSLSSLSPSLTAGGKGIKRCYYNYKKTQRGRINKTYSKKIKRLKRKTKRRTRQFISF